MRAHSVSLWTSSSEEEDNLTPLDGDAETEVAIVGAGFTGLSTALHCAERGLGVHVLEAVHLGFGGSGRAVGLVNAGVWHPPAKVRASLGDTVGPRFMEKFGSGPEQVFSLIERHQIRCEATRTGTIHAAHAPSGLTELRSRHAEWTRLGAPVELLTKSDARDLIGTDKFFGGLLDQRAGTVNPMGYCRGLARAARAAGAIVNTGTQVTALARADGVWNLTTHSGTVRAKFVVLGTNAYTDDLWPDLRSAFTPIRYFQLATRPLGERVSRILPGRQGVWDTNRFMLSVRRDAHDRLIIGSMGSVIGGRNHGLSQRWARKKLEWLFPDLGPVEFEEAWDGRIAMTPDHLPRILELAPKLFTPIGYNGRGITTGTIFGESMAQLIAGDDPAHLPLPVRKLTKVRFAGLMTRLYETAFAANQFLKSL